MGAKLNNDMERLQAQLSALQEQQADLEAELAAQLASKEDTEERQELVGLVNEESRRNQELKKECQSYAGALFLCIAKLISIFGVVHAHVGTVRNPEPTHANTANDPENLEKMKKAAEEAKAAANRYMDNCWSIQSWAKKTFGAGGDTKNLDAFFAEAGLTDSLDYVQ